MAVGIADRSRVTFKIIPEWVTAAPDPVKQLTRIGIFER